jgi:hypothetical protein
LVLRDGLNFILASTIIHPPQIAYSSVFGSNKWYQSQLLFLIHLNQKLENIAMYRYSTKPCILDGVDFQFCKAKMEVYIQAQGYAIWEKTYKPYEVPEDNALTAANMPQVEAHSKARNNIFQGLGRSDFDRVVHLKSAYQVCKEHCDCHPRSYECGSISHIHPKCPKFLARIIRDEDEKEEDDEQDKKKHTSKTNKEKGYLNRKVVHHILAALNQVNSSDVDSDSD